MRLLDFLELEDEPDMREFFATQITAEYGHLGRWRTELSPSRRLTVTARYAFRSGGSRGRALPPDPRCLR